MERELLWELDRQVVLTQLQNVMLALRSNSRFGAKSRFFGANPQAADHPLLQGAMDLHNQLLFCSAPPASSVGAGGRSTSSHANFEREASTGLNASLASEGSHGQAAPHNVEGSYERDVVRSLRTSMQRTIAEEDILAPFYAVCRSADASETLASVAVAGLVAILSHPCSFISVKGIRLTLESVAMTRNSNSAANSSSHEILTARMIQAYTACIRHPAAVELAEESYVRAVSRTLVLALRPETSPLLKRTAENALNTIVSTLFSRVIASSPCLFFTPFAGVPACGLSSEAPVPPAVGIEGTAMMRYISSLISGEVTALDSEGNTIAMPHNAPEGVRLGSSPNGRGAKTDGSGKSAHVVVSDSGAAIQLEGLWLAQAALFAISHHLNNDKLRRLRSAVQNDLSRALLVAGVGTTHVVVLSQILRTMHIAVKCASRHLVPQMLSFLRVLHLSPLATLTEELSRAESMAAGGSGGFFGGGGARYGSPPPPSGGSGSPNGPGSPTNSTYLSSSQLMDMYERKEVLLESLAEFCSDADFLSFCYSHFDLSWHYTPVLPQLCDVLVSNAYVYGDLDEGGVGSRDSDRSSSMANGRGLLRGTSEGGSSGRFVRPVNRLQLVALDAAANMVSEISFRTMMSLTPNHHHLHTALSTPSQLPVQPSDDADFAGLSLTKELVQGGVDHMIAQKKLLLQFASLFEDSPHKKGIPFLLEHAIRVNSREEEAAVARARKTWLIVRNPAGGREIGHTLFRLSVLLDKRALGDHIGELGRERGPKPTEDDLAAILPDGTIVTSAPDVAAILAAIAAERTRSDESSSASAENQSASGSAAAPAIDTQGTGTITPDGTRIVSALELWTESRKTDHLVVGTIRFYEEQLIGFIEMFDFYGKPLLTAIREMVYRLCLPGESQKIDRIMEAFAKHWYAQNEGDRTVNPFHSDSGAFVLSFAIIMLNTVFHSKRLDRTLTLSDFKGMNRGIDDGNNIPDEYLAAIYEDVQKHEVVMAEMMDRGFANDVTWDLEMNSVEQRAFHGVDGTLAGLLDLIGEEAAAQGGLPQDATRAVTAPRRRDHVQQVLDPLIFSAVWKRCLLVFTGMVESAGTQVARLSPRGTSIKDAIAHTRALMPTEVSALLSSLRGIQMLSRAAHALGASGVSDQCMLTLLPHVALDLFGAQDVVDGFYRSLPKLLCAREIFTLLRTTASSLVDSWPSLSDFMVKLYLLGFFAVQPQKEAGAQAISHPLSELPEVLCANPGIVDSDAAARKKATANEGGGWFSSFFGGGSSSSSDNNNNSNNARGGSLSAFDISTVTSQPRVRECIPDMPLLLRVLATTPPHAHKLFLQALIANRNRQSKSNQPLDTQEAFVFSYEVCFAAAVAITTPATVFAQHRKGACTQGSKEVTDVMGEFLPYLENGLTRMLDAVIRNTQRRRAGLAGTMDPAIPYWTSVADRAISGVLRVTQHGLFRQYRKLAADAAGAPAPMLEFVWRELQVFLDLPQPAFATFAALPVARFVEDWADALTAHVGIGGALPHDALEMHMLVPLLSRVTALLARNVEPEVSASLCRASLRIAGSALYDVRQQTEIFVDAILAVGVVRGQQEKFVGVSVHGSQSPHPSAVSHSSSVPGADDSAVSHNFPSGSIHAPLGEVVGLCCRNVLHAAQESRSTGTGEENANTPPAELQLWLFCLRRLAGLVMCAGSPRAGSESLLSLQRALQDTALDCLPAAVIQSIYNDVLFPMVELICAPGSELHVNTFAHSSPTLPQAQLLSVGADDASNGGTNASAGLLASILGAATPPQSPPVAERPSHLLPIMPAEVKCRVVNLLPKVLLQYIGSLAQCPELLQDLWQRVLGTLYAVYTAFPPGSSAPLGASASSRRGSSPPASEDAAGELTSDEASMMREAVEETVKNMVYVVAAVGTESDSVFHRVPYFSTATRNLIRPFSFAGPLLAFLDSVEGSTDASEVGSAA